MLIFAWPVRIYYEDTDHGGVVYHANYLKYMERARTEFFRAQGIELDVLQKRVEVIYALRRSDVEYLLPAKFNDLLLVTSQIIESSRVKLTFTQKIYNAGSIGGGTSYGCFMDEPTDNKLLVQADVSVVSLCAKKLKPKRIPEYLLEELMRER